MTDTEQITQVNDDGIQTKNDMHFDICVMCDSNNMKQTDDGEECQDCGWMFEYGDDYQGWSLHQLNSELSRLQNQYLRALEIHNVDAAETIRTEMESVMDVMEDEAQ